MDNMRIQLTLLAAVLVAVASAGCRSESDDTFRVAVSIEPQAWLVERIAGPEVDVVTLVSPGENPHSYMPTDAQISKVMRSKAYFRIGVPFERGAWFAAIQESGRVQIVDVRKGIALRKMATHRCTHDHDHAHHHHHEPGDDPHIWLSPQLLIQQARNVASAMIALDPEGESGYQARLSTLVDELLDLDGYLRDSLQPFEGRAFFVFHPAWGYFADAYKLREESVEIEGKEPTDSELTELQNLAREADAKVIFVQPQITGKSAQAIASGVGARLERVDPLARNVADNLRSVCAKIVASYEDASDGQL